MVATSGPIGARLQPHFRPTVVMTGAAAVGAGEASGVLLTVLASAGGIGLAVVVMTFRASLVRRGLMAPLSMKANWEPPTATSGAEPG
jgi:hypothetical protein